MEELNNHFLWDSHTRILDKYTLRDKALITDDQYKEHTEDLFLLFCIKLAWNILLYQTLITYVNYSN